MSRIGTFAVVTIVAASLAGSVALAQGPGRGGRGPGGFGGFGGPADRGGPGGPGTLPLRELNLTEAQQQQVRDIVQRYREQNQSIAEQLRTAMDAQRKALETMPIDEGLIRSTVQNLVEAQTEMAIQEARMTNEIFALLTSAQQDQVRKLQADREARAQQLRQRRQQQRGT